MNFLRWQTLPESTKFASRDFDSVIRERACSSVGRAPALQAGCRKFDPCQVHHLQKEILKKNFTKKSYGVKTLSSLTT